MVKYAFTVKEDVCEKNGKDASAKELLLAMSHYGEVESFETSVAKVKLEYQATIDNLSTQLASIKEQELTEDELNMVRAYRSAKNSIVAKYVAENDGLKESLRKADEKAKDMSKKICETLALYATVEE